MGGLSATPTTIKDEAGNLVQIPSAATTSVGNMSFLQNLQNQQNIFSCTRIRFIKWYSVQCSVSSSLQIQSSDGQQVQIGFTGSSDNGGINQESGQIQIIPGSNQTLLASGTPPANIRISYHRLVRVQVQGVAIGGFIFSWPNPSSC